MSTLNEFIMKGMGTGHLLNALACEPNATRTTLELELMKRCERFAEYEAIVAACEEFDYKPTGDDIRAIGESHWANWDEYPKLLAVCQEFGIENAKQLREELCRRY